MHTTMTAQTKRQHIRILRFPLSMAARPPGGAAKVRND